MCDSKVSEEIVEIRPWGAALTVMPKSCKLSKKMAKNSHDNHTNVSIL